jgi:hypothetical protein
MRDSVERMLHFVREQRQQAVLETVRIGWSRKVPVLLPCLRAVVETFQSGLAEPSPQSTVAILDDLARLEFPLVIAFERRPCERPGILRMHSTASGTEVGASCLFRCESDGIVYGYRYPFHSVLRDVRPERFADLGEPEFVQPDQIGNAVVEFLMWASVGEGCGSRKLRFGSPAEHAPQVHEEMVELRVVAA